MALSDWYAASTICPLDTTNVFKKFRDGEPWKIVGTSSGPGPYTEPRALGNEVIRRSVEAQITHPSGRTTYPVTVPGTVPPVFDHENEKLPALTSLLPTVTTIRAKVKIVVDNLRHTREQPRTFCFVSTRSIFMPFLSKSGIPVT